MHLVCGEALYDVFVDDGAADSDPEIPLRAIAGGSPFNVAIGMARLGAQVGFASDLAQDFLGERIVTQLKSEGVSDRFLRRSVAASAFAIVATDQAGRPIYSFSGLEHAFYCPTNEAEEEAEATITGIHVGSIAVVLPNSAGALLDLVRRFADRALITFDPNVRLSVVPALSIWRRAIEALQPLCHVIKVSEEDIAALYGDADPYAVCRGWLADRTELVVLTRGADGASMISRGAGRVDIPAAGVSVVDTVGAGDSFMAALLSTLIRKGWVSSETIAALSPKQLYELGSFASRAAGLTCSRRGPMLPTVLELEALGVQSMAADI